MHVALLRGINVGKAKRVAMADLRSILEDLGHEDVSTLLMSGNAVFRSSSGSTDALAKAIEAAITQRLGMDVRVFVRSAAAVRKAVDANPLAKEAAKDPSRFHLAFLQERADRKSLTAVVDTDWSPEAFAIGDGVLYAWHPNGVTGSKLAEALMKTKGPAQTSRNLATITKILDRAASLS